MQNTLTILMWKSRESATEYVRHQMSYGEPEIFTTVTRALYGGLKYGEGGNVLVHHGTVKTTFNDRPRKRDSTLCDWLSFRRNAHCPPILGKAKVCNGLGLCSYLKESRMCILSGNTIVGIVPRLQQRPFASRLIHVRFYHHFRELF